MQRPFRELVFREKSLHFATVGYCIYNILIFFISIIELINITKMKKDGATVSSDVLVKICTALNCTMDDIVEIIPAKEI